MERQLPKNVRQIGNVCDEPKIYVEDYVDTFLGQLQEKAMEKPVAAALTGEITKCEDKVVVYISGAIRAEDVEVEGTNLKISEEIWEKIEKEQKEYFKDKIVSASRFHRLYELLVLIYCPEIQTSVIRASHTLNFFTRICV